ncbi:MAG: sigma-54 dependent transcriptional regulator, partial [Myxococcota bacterium]
AMRDVIGRGLTRHDLDVVGVASGEEALLRLGNEEFDVVLADLQLEGMDGLELCRCSQEVQPGIPVIVITGYGSFDNAVAAIRAGAYDFLAKPIDIDVLAVAVWRAIERRHLAREVTRLRARVEAVHGFGDLVGSSLAMQKVYDLLARAAPSDASVLIVGDSGTGKELAARALHRAGRRNSGPFIAVNCAAVPEALLESELFGHVRGAFTDAHSDRPGLFVEANGGTLFLDEIGDMPLSMQVKLLRALQERTVRPIGGRRETRFDVRIITATNRDIDSDVEDGAFREDLYFRINVIRIDLPPLRARGTDILNLANHLLKQVTAEVGKAVTSISSDAAERMLAYDWPGNVRELRNCIERAVALARYDQIVVADLPEKIRKHRRSPVLLTAESAEELVSLDEIQRRYVLRVVEATNGNRTMAARILGLDRKTLRRKLERWGAGKDKERDKS